MQQVDELYENLFTPWKIRDVEIKNRIVLCPMGGTSLFGWMELTGNHFDKEAAKFFLEKAQNNVGLIITGIAPIKSTYWGQWLYENKKMFKELKEFMDEIHKTGTKLFIQLTAGMGRSWAITSPLVPLAKSKVVSTLIKPIIDLPYESASPSELPSRWAEDMTTPASLHNFAVLANASTISWISFFVSARVVISSAQREGNSLGEALS